MSESNDQQIVLITGANTGLGLAAAITLAKNGAHILMACRNEDRAAQAKARLLKVVPGAIVESISLDLANADSIEKCAETVARHVARVDVLINNAGVMLPEVSASDEASVEPHMAVNFLGHFALTAKLWPLLLCSSSARVVHVTSMAAQWASLGSSLSNQEVIAQRGLRAYAVSKLANLVFSVELARRAKATSVASIACHPGYVATDLQRNMWLARIGNPLLGMSSARGSRALVHAATVGDINSGSFWGPGLLGGLYGPVKQLPIYRAARNEVGAQRLWQFGESHCDLQFSLDHR